MPQVKMSGRALGAALAALVATGVVVLSPGAPAAPSGPPLETPEEELRGALRCPDRFEDAREPVLLVHGTFALPEENWGWNYASALPARGYDVCTVRLPDRATGDIQRASEFVVFAVREMHARSGRTVDVLGHSQGGLQPRWAVKWWPDVRDAVDDLVMLATPNHGTVAADLAYEFGCFESCMQMSTRSQFIAALNADDETPGDISYTSVYSLTDELVQPAFPEATAALDGASNVLMQELCPGRPVEHVQFAADGAVHAVVMDALDNPGPFDPERFDPLACASTWMDGLDLAYLPTLLEGGDNALAALAGAEYESGDEPPLRPYAQANGAASDGETEGESDQHPAPGDAGGPSAGERVLGAVDSGPASTTAPTPATGGLPTLFLALGVLLAAALARVAGGRGLSGWAPRPRS